MNKKSLLIIIPSVFILGLVLVAKIINNKKESQPTENAKNTQSILDPVIKNNVDTISSKKKIYKTGEMEKMASEEKQKNSTISFEEMGNVENSKKRSNDLSYGENNENASASEKKVTTTESRQKEKNIQHNSNKKQRPFEKTSDSDKNQSNFNNYSGIYLGSSDKKSNDASGSQAEKFISAMLEDDKVIKNTSSVIFHLCEEAEIDGVKFKKYSIVYAAASIRNGYFDIVSNYIENGYDGKKYPVKLVLYNENYSRGINYDDNANETVKGSKNTAVDEISYQATSGNPLANAATNVVKSAVRGKDEIKVSIYSGRKVYFKKDNI